jgi:hypothetical protein
MAHSLVTWAMWVRLQWQWRLSGGAVVAWRRATFGGAVLRQVDDAVEPHTIDAHSGVKGGGVVAQVL